MRQNLYLNVTEHEVLAPRTREAWDHDPMYCYLCWPGEFWDARTSGQVFLTDFIWPSPRLTREQFIEKHRTHPSVIEEDRCRLRDA